MKLKRKPYPTRPTPADLPEILEIRRHNLEALRNAARLRTALILCAPLLGFVAGLVVVALDRFR